MWMSVKVVLGHVELQPSLCLVQTVLVVTVVFVSLATTSLMELAEVFHTQTRTDNISLVYSKIIVAAK